MPALAGASARSMIPVSLARALFVAVGSGVAVSRDPQVLSALIIAVGGLVTVLAGQVLQQFFANRRQRLRDEMQARLASELAHTEAALSREREETRRLRALLRQGQGHEPPA